MSERYAPLRLHGAFAVLGAAFLAMFAWVFLSEYLAEWRVLQKRFGVLQKTLKDPHALSLAAPTGSIRQIWLPDLDRVDRCPTCHLGIDDPAFTRVPQPFKVHAGRLLDTHPPERFGCTACHGGQGSATTYRDAAHKPIPYWAEPMRSGDLLQANCGACHRERRPPGAPVLEAGRALVADAGCPACHELPGFPPDGVRAPQLDNVGAKLRADWLRKWLADPAATLPNARMPNFRLSPDDIESLSAYLLSHRRDESAITAIDWAGADAARGRALFEEAQCRTCHVLEGKGGKVGPDLTSVGKKARRDWLVAFIKNPQREQPRTLMPRYNFTDPQVRDLVAFLAPSSASDGAVAARDDRSPDPKLVAAGHDAFTRNGCYGCHRLTGTEGLPKIGPPLAGIGDRHVEADAGNVGAQEQSLPAWLRRKLVAPNVVTPGSRMPSFRFSEKETAAVVVALLSLRRADLPASRVTDAPRHEPYQPQGAFGALLARYRCLSCHTMRDTGGELATVPLDRIGSQLQRAYIARYLEHPFPVRLHMEERMPRLFMTGTEAEALAGYLSDMFVDDAFDVPVAADPAQARRGAELFATYECLNCHALGGQGASVGPNLTGVARKLKPGWIRAWLMTPEVWKPGTLHPSLGLSDGDARALAAFLLTRTAGAEPAADAADGRTDVRADRMKDGANARR